MSRPHPGGRLASAAGGTPPGAAYPRGTYRPPPGVGGGCSPDSLNAVSPPRPRFRGIGHGAPRSGGFGGVLGRASSGVAVAASLSALLVMGAFVEGAGAGGFGFAAIRPPPGGGGGVSPDVTLATGFFGSGVFGAARSGADFFVAPAFATAFIGFTFIGGDVFAGAFLAGAFLTVAFLTGFFAGFLAADLAPAFFAGFAAVFPRATFLAPADFFAALFFAAATFFAAFFAVISILR